MQPTIGRIVHYKLTNIDAEQINRRRVAQPASPEWPKGAVAHSGNSVSEGDVFPMIITRIFDPETKGSAVNGQVLLDGNDTFWATSRKEGDEAGNWFWPPRV